MWRTTKKNVDLTPVRPLCLPYDPAVRLFVLLIGIDDYPEVTKLKAAVADARAMRKYLRDYLRIPDDHITELYDKKATRAEIIKAFRGLRDDDRINKDDAVLVFYAGHGCEMNAPAGWDTDGQKIQGLVPYDYKTPNTKGEPTTALPDRTVSALIEDIAAVKGDNITVVLDCCHSTSGTRVETLTYRSRRVKDEDIVPLPQNIDEHYINRGGRKSRVSQVPSGFAHRSLRSHVLLAACGSQEEAKEGDDQGEFTKALLSTLIRLGIDNLTYTQLMDSFPKLQQQNPQCEGKNVARILFNNKLAGATPDMVRVEVVDGVLMLRAGLAQGIAVGARFDIFQNHHIDSESNPRLATVSVAIVQNFNSALRSSGELQQLQSPAYARLVSPGQEHTIKVFVSPALQQKLCEDTVWKDEFMSQDSELPARLTSDQDTADLCLNIDTENQVTFDTRNPLSNQSGVTRLLGTVSAEAKPVLDVLRAAAAWDWHVSRGNEQRPFGDLVRIEMYRVVEDLKQWDDDGRPIIRRGENLNKTGVVNIQVDQSYYGYQIVNKSNVDLYPALFYFNVTRLSIIPYYLSPIPAGGEIDIPLPRRGSLPVGYGPGGTIPFQYSLPENADIDVGIIKVFVTTAPANFGLLEQVSPFDRTRQDVRKVSVKARLAACERWDTQYMVLRQHETLPPSIEAELVSPLEMSITMSDTMSTSEHETILHRKHELWVILPIATLLSLVPFVLFYLFKLS